MLKTSRKAHRLRRPWTMEMVGCIVCTFREKIRMKPEQGFGAAVDRTMDKLPLSIYHEGFRFHYKLNYSSNPCNPSERWRNSLVKNLP
ncbi:hypothetical protein RRG08_008229 [Elysia crispata]|uniref:Uncharacterized protein n=1 Tax=Elysia crispata TaxID=231223 RepID=A0AAE0YCW5_9GAST|nr:hypothetical protein RRG08_008229 [Elysia crispata]